MIRISFIASAALFATSTAIQIASNEALSSTPNVTEMEPVLAQVAFKERSIIRPRTKELAKTMSQLEEVGERVKASPEQLERISAAL